MEKLLLDEYKRVFISNTDFPPDNNDKKQKVVYNVFDFVPPGLELEKKNENTYVMTITKKITDKLYAS